MPSNRERGLNDLPTGLLPGSVTETLTADMIAWAWSDISIPADDGTCTPDSQFADDVAFSDWLVAPVDQAAVEWKDNRNELKRNKR